MKQAPIYLTVPGIAKTLGKARQSIRERYVRGTMPAPDAFVDGRPAWKRATLERAEILPPS